MIYPKLLAAKMVGFPSIGASCNNRRQQSKWRVLTKETFHLLINSRRKHRRKVAIHKKTNIQQKTYHSPLELSFINKGRFGQHLASVVFLGKRGEKREKGGGGGVTHYCLARNKYSYCDNKQYFKMSVMNARS